MNVAIRPSSVSGMTQLGRDAGNGGRPSAAWLTTLLLAVVAVAAAGCGGAAKAADGQPSASAQPRLRVMIFGDSTTQETAGDYTWRYRLAAHLSFSAPGRVDFVGTRDDVHDNVSDTAGSHAYLNPMFDSQHSSVWGDSLYLETPKVESVLRKVPADVALVLLGGNDLEFRTNAPQTVVKIKQFIDNARKANPKLTFVLGHVLTRWNPEFNAIALPQAVAYNKLLDQAAPGWSTSTSQVITAPTDLGWNPREDTWDGSHPNPNGEMLIARGFANALHDLGIGGRFGAVFGNLTWPEKGGVPVAAPAGGTHYTVTWPAAPGATAYLIERRTGSTDTQTYVRWPAQIKGLTFTTENLSRGSTVYYRVIPVKAWMTGQPGPAVEINVPSSRA
ncbi:GDSL family lipase [Frankia sp. AgB1.9]|nr:GDSL family lipase [Frankia sp. AgW1.1]MBL7549052.1 GDSL family lipase [Frankia sp. AgB1.9]MBL7624303.1 GDSL family lipase [Frankia sp. AgB1.8]